MMDMLRAMCMQHCLQNWSTFKVVTWLVIVLELSAIGPSWLTDSFDFFLQSVVTTTLSLVNLLQQRDVLIMHTNLRQVLSSLLVVLTVELAQIC